MAADGRQEEGQHFNDCRIDLRRGQNTAERGLRGEQSNAVMAVGRMAYVGVIVERDDVSNGRRLAWCFMVVIMLGNARSVRWCEKMDKAVR